MTIILKALFLSVVTFIFVMCIFQEQLALRPSPPLPISKIDSYEARYTSPAHRLINLEFKYNAINKLERDRANYMMDLAISDFSDVSVDQTPKGIILFFQKIAKWIDGYFIYYPGTGFSEGINLGGIDCDLRSYIYLSIAKSKGIDGVSLMMSPNHAFIVWKNKSGIQIPWETTGQKGNIVDLTKPMYKESKNPKAYTFIEGEDLDAMFLFDVALEVRDKTENTALVLELLRTAAELSDNTLFKVELANAEKNTIALTKYAKDFPSYAGGIESALGDYEWDKKKYQSAVKHYKSAISLNNYGDHNYSRVNDFTHGEFDLYLYYNGTIFNIVNKIFGEKTSSRIKEEFVIKLPIIFIVLFICFFVITYLNALIKHVSLTGSVEETPKVTDLS